MPDILPPHAPLKPGPTNPVPQVSHKVSGFLFSALIDINPSPVRSNNKNRRRVTGLTEGLGPGGGADTLPNRQNIAGQRIFQTANKQI